MGAARTLGRRRLGRLGLALALLTALTLTLPAAPPAEAAPAPVTVVNALDDGRPTVRLDTDGNPLDAHDGQLLTDGGRYWLIGMAYSCGQEWPGRKTPGVVSTTCGVRAYSSPDLVTWRNEGYLVDGSAMPPVPKAACTPACWRPKAVRSGTGWTIWVNSPYQSTSKDYQVFTTPGAFTGPYTWAGQSSLSAPAGGPGQDFTLYDDPVTGDAYIASLSAGRGIYVQKLNRTRTDVDPGAPPVLVGGALAAAAAAEVSAAATQGLTGEAPLMTRGPNGDAYVMIGVPLCGFCTGGSGLAYTEAASFDGPFPPAQMFMDNACSTQSTSVLAVPSTTGGTRWLFQGDRWWESPMTVGLPPKPFAGTTGNQGPGSQWFEEMTFGADGTPSMTCNASWTLPDDVVLGASGPAAGAPLGVACGAKPRTTQTATLHVATTGDVDAVELNVFASEAPDAPARLTVRNAAGVVFGSAGLPFVPANVPTRSGVSWSPFTVSIPMSTRLAAGDYVVAMTHAGTRGCYGLLTTAQNEVRAHVVAARTTNTTRPTLRGMAPRRLLDTRTSGGRILGGTTRHVSVAGVAGVPKQGAGMVALTVTALNGAAPGWADIRPCTAGYNATSAINFVTTAVVSGSGAYAPDANGELCVQVSTAVDIILDVTGWMPASDLARFNQPYRIADTRTGVGGVARGVLTLSPMRRVHTGLAPGSAAVVAATEVQGTVGGWLAVTRCDAPFPGTSTVNAAAGVVREAMAVAVVDSAGDICLVANKPANAVVDLLGVVRPGGGVVQSNRRLVDTRTTRTRLAAQQTLRVPVQGGHLLTVTAVAPSGKGWLAVFPCGGSNNGTSTVNYNATDLATSGSVMISTTTGVCVKTSTAADVLVDDVATFS